MVIVSLFMYNVCMYVYLCLLQPILCVDTCHCRRTSGVMATSHRMMPESLGIKSDVISEGFGDKTSVANVAQIKSQFVQFDFKNSTVHTFEPTIFA